MKKRSKAYMQQAAKDVVRLVAFLGISDPMHIASFQTARNSLRQFRRYKRLSDAEVDELFFMLDKKRWMLWTIHVIVKGDRQWLYID